MKFIVSFTSGCCNDDLVIKVNESQKSLIDYLIDMDIFESDLRVIIEEEDTITDLSED